MLALELNHLFSIILIVDTFVLLWIANYAWQRRKVASAASFSMGMLAAAICTFGYAFEIISTHVDHVVFWIKFQYIGIPFIMVFWLTLAFDYTGSWKLIKKWIFSLFFLLAITSVILQFTNDFHHLIYREIKIDYNLLFPVVTTNTGAWYWVIIAYGNIAMILGVVLYGVMYAKSVPIIRRQILLMVVGSIIPWILHISYLLKGFGYPMNLSPFGFTLSGLFFFWAIFKFKFLQLIPIALEKVFESMKDGVIILDSEYNIINFNKAAKDIIQELVGLEKGTANGLAAFSNYPELIKAMLNDDKHGSKLLFKQAEEHLYCYNIVVTRIHDKKNRVIGKIIVLNDITEQRELMERLDKLASTDDLTQIYNRRYFEEQCVLELGRSQRHLHPISFIIFDLDNFKGINDLYGHPTGDAVLQWVANRCRSLIRMNDTIARFGGDEFAVLLPETNVDDAFCLAERLRSGISETPFRYGSLKLNITGSFGIYGTALVNEDLSELMIKADKALYKAKSQGRNRVEIFRQSA